MRYVLNLHEMGLNRILFEGVIQCLKFVICYRIFRDESLKTEWF